MTVLLRNSRTVLPSPEFAPVRVDQIEIGAPLSGLAPPQRDAGTPYRSSMCLVRLHGRPLGRIQVELPSGGLSADALAARIQAELGEPLARHLRDDGMAPGPLHASGIEGTGQPPCVAKGEELLRHAPSVSVVIPTRDRPASVAATVGSIIGSRYPSERYEVIVVDNGSGTDARARLPEAALNGSVPVRLVREEAPGPANARNRGLAHAEGEIVVFADDDVVVDPDWLARLVHAFDRSEQVGAASGLVVPSQLETPAQVWFEAYFGRALGFEPRLFDIAHPPPDEPLFPFTVGALGTGANMAFRRRVLRRLGGLDPALGPGTPARSAEDIEVLLRVLLAGYRVAYEPAAIVHHAQQPEYEQLRRRMFGYGVGLTAALTKTVIDNPRLLLDLGRKLPRGIAFAVAPTSPKNERKQHDFPRELTRLELRGMASGPLAYARSRRRARSSATPSPRSLRALIVTDSDPALIGGANRSAQLLARRLTDRGHTVEIATAWQQGLPVTEDDGVVRVHRLRDLTSRMRWISEDPYKHNPPPFPDPEGLWRMRRLIRRFQPDLIHSYGWLTHTVAAALVGLRIPLLVTARDYGNVCAVRTLVRDGEICEGPELAKCLRCAGNTYGPAKGTVATLSVFGSRPLVRRKTTAGHSVSRFVDGVMDRHLRPRALRSAVIPNFLEEDPAEPVDEAVLARLPETPFILFVGALRRIKGIHELFAAYERLDSPPPLVLAATRAPDTPERLPKGVTVVADVPHPTVMAMWERALFGVAPTKSPEALGNVVLEAMSRSRAVIGTRPGGHEDIIDDGKTGLLVPAGDATALARAMACLIEDPQLRDGLGRRARERARDFTPEVVVPRLERLYLDTVTRFRQARP